MPIRIPTATYRLQLSASFTLRDAKARVPYLRRLGVSHLYLSPVLAARPGSTHGYDVADPTHVNEELGGDDAFIALANEVHAHDMGIVLDIVPNHMGIGPTNPYWDDVLAHGRSSRYASWFDVEWRAPTRRLAGKVLLPVLGDTLDAVLARDELTLDVSDQGVRVRYFDHHFPLDPATLPPELELAMRDPWARDVVRDWDKGAEGREKLRALLDAQHYELGFWRLAQRDLNYRRFFDVNELISLRVERSDVFEATHARVLQLVADGHVDGLRVDHIDGLLEPRRYLERLRAAVDVRRPAAGGERFPILVEKILAAGETLPSDWPVDGTTGYELMTTLEDVFVHPEGYARLEARYRQRGAPDFHTVAVEAKRRVLRSALNADVRRIAPMLLAVARRAKWEALTIAAYAGAIVELVAVLPVYRTYLDAEKPDAEGADRAVLVDAFAQVRERGRADAKAVDALERALLGQWGGRDVEPELARTRLAFVLRWQQLTGPAAAKGVEDTAFYVYAPLASRNEVGGDPGASLSDAVPRLHARLAERAARYPRALNATNTHDTKRSADVRARLDALSENPASWERHLRQWRRHNRGMQTLVAAGGRLAPTRTTDNFIYQAMIGVWPVGAKVRATDDDRWLGELRERLTAYIRKAVREAKVSTSWTDPDEAYEQAIDRFIAGILDRSTNARFLHDVERFVTALTPQGRWNTFGRLVVHLTAPGVPDLYQGDELWFRALVDPDNRRPVDWEARERALDRLRDALAPDAEVTPEQLAQWCARPEDDGLKLYLTTRLLHLRQTAGPLFSRGSYAPLGVEGARARNVVAFSRQLEGEACLVVIPRLTCELGEPIPIGSTWGDTKIRLGGADTVGTWRCVVGGTVVQSEAGVLPVGEALARLPVAVLVPATGRVRSIDTRLA
ncbi:MAG TPA: malto-oligosyltrehalose synthase [Gemmatimonadaceae bacterium]